MHCTLKTDFKTESYVQNVYCKKYRSALAKLRCGIAQIRLETGRYEGLSAHQWLCPFCIGTVEDEVRVITLCSLYIDMRNELYTFISTFIPDFNLLCDLEKKLR